MDKFGIFKLLSSFLSYYAQSTSSTSNDHVKPVTTPNALTNTLKNVNDLLNAPVLNPKKTERNSLQPPLQQTMIQTIQSHDRFVNRVNKNKPN